MKQSETIAKLTTALAKAQAQLPMAAKIGTGHHGTYANLEAVWAACRTPLAENDLAVIQTPGATQLEDGHPVASLTTILAHTSGEWISETLTMPMTQGTPQAYGSAITYARRYALASFVGIVAGDDDDGDESSGKGNKQQPLPRQAQQNGRPPAKPGARAVKVTPPPVDGNRTDLKSWLQEKATQAIDGPVVKLGFVADTAVMAGKYNDREHVKNTLKKTDAPVPPNFEVDYRRNVSLKGGLHVLDWLLDRKAVDVDEINEELFGG
jgi:hypothetical protein